MRSPPSRSAAAFAACILIAVAVVRPAFAREGTAALGANVESLLAAARQLSPALQAAALATKAAGARADAAGALPDPMFTITGDRMNRQTDFMFSQTFPLWGKRDLQHQAALQALEAMRGQERATRDELDERIKVAFAQYYAVSRGIAINADIARLARQMTGAETARYSQGQGSQAGAVLTAAEETRVATEAARLSGDRRAAIARINALLARPAEAPLAAPIAPRPIPAALPPIPGLVERARAGNPQLFSVQADIQQAEAQRRLAGKAWYPDVTIAAGPAQPDKGPTGFSASVSFSIPLQQGPKQAGVQEAAANLAAARRRLDATMAQIEGDLGQAVASLEAARKMEALLRTRQLPQYNAAYRAVLAGYGQGRGDLSAALEAERRLRDTNIDILRSQLDEQTALAAIERLIGGAL